MSRQQTRKALIRLQKNFLMPYENNKDTDQPVHPCSLIRIFVVHSLDSIISVSSILENSRL